MVHSQHPFHQSTPHRLGVKQVDCPFVIAHLSKAQGNEMGLFIFARFHARLGNENGVAQAVLDVIIPTRAEPGCLNIHAFRSLRDRQLFYIHSHWRDEAAFELHATLPHTVHFLEQVEPLIDHPLDVNRTEQIG